SAGSSATLAWARAEGVRRAVLWCRGRTARGAAPRRAGGSDRGRPRPRSSSRRSRRTRRVDRRAPSPRTPARAADARALPIGEALGAYRDARAALDELGLEPGEHLRALERAVLTQDSSLDLPPARLLPEGNPIPLPGPLVPASPFPFVGREQEVAALRTLLDR